MDRSSDPALQGLQRNAARAIKAAVPAVLNEPLGEVVSNCDQHGSYRRSGIRYLGVREIWTPCPDCREAEIAAERQREAQESAKATLARMEAMLEQAAVPARFKGRSLDNFVATTAEQKHALSIACEFAANFSNHAERGTGLVLSGLPGTGKSHLGTAIQQAIMPDHCSLYVTALGIVRAVRNTWRRGSELTETQVLSMFGSVPLLVIDEIGVQYGTDGEQTILFDVLDKRYRDMQPTILLTNQDKRGLKEFIGERSFDRLTETARWVPFDWASHRPTARKEFGA